MSDFRFAIMGAGNIAHKFCDAVQRTDGCTVTAVAGKSMDRASDFAARNGIAAAYDSYEQMLIEQRPDCVYIAVTANAHYDLSMLCLRHNVPVLCEKAMFISGSQAESAFSLASERSTFAMEAMWSRFLPANKKAKEWVEQGRIGAPVHLDFTIGFLADKDPGNRYFNPDLGGGAAFDLTVYAYEISTYLVPQSIQEMHVSAIFGDTGVDITNHVGIRFSNMTASLTASIAAPMEERVVLYGENGRIVVPHPHYADEAFLYTPGYTLCEHYQDVETQNGFVYQIRETIDCITSGKIQSPIVPHRLTLDCARLFDRIYQQPTSA